MKWAFKSKESGFVTVEFLIVGMMVFFLVFVGTDFWIIQTKQQACEHLKNYYLDRVRVEGYLSAADESEMAARFQNAGCPVVSVSAPRESQGDSRVLRNTGDPTDSEVWLYVEACPAVQPFVMGGLIGSAPSGEFTIKVGGRALSERVDP
jgi:hypothetical protein